MNNNETFEQKAVFILDTVFSMSVIAGWVLEGLNKIYRKENDTYEIYEFKTSVAESGKYSFYNSVFDVTLYSDNKEMYLEIGKHRETTSDDAFAKIVTDIFKIIHRVTGRFADSEIPIFEKFFFKRLTLENEYSISEIDIFEETGLECPMKVEYPKSKQRSAAYNLQIESDFIDELLMDYSFEVSRNEEENEMFSTIRYDFSGKPFDRKYPSKEQISLVEDMMKELLSRAALFRKEVESKIN